MGDARSGARGGAQWRALVFGGLLPVVAFTVIEEAYGTVAGLVAGMVFGVGEVLWEWRREGRVSGLTWGGNALLLGLGGISLATGDGVFFKLQPSILEAAFAAVMWASLLAPSDSAPGARGSLMESLARKQGTWERTPQALRPRLSQRFRGVTFRTGLFFGGHAGLAAWAAFHWSSEAWGLLKGVGLTVSFVLYLGAEMWGLRRGLTAV